MNNHLNLVKINRSLREKLKNRETVINRLKHQLHTEDQILAQIVAKFTDR